MVSHVPGGSIMELLVTLAVFYHLAALFASLTGVFLALCRLRGMATERRLIRPLILNGELHLWLSGLLIIALGVALKGMPYFDNPKLWTKVILITLWSLNSWLLRHYSRSGLDQRRIAMFAISLGSLIYGSFLGVAKPLAYGVAPFWGLLAGYAACLLLTGLLLQRSRRWLSSPAIA
ncbi:hypothetical protein ACLIIZ_11935 [Azonexus caeni]|jgi:hypothetical protein|uniref:hypothetical protein n=1 Tax=Azonexus caeni TaxID=266126 RepID=UPI003A855FF3